MDHYSRNLLYTTLKVLMNDLFDHLKSLIIAERF